MAPEEIVVAAMRHRGQTREDVRRQIMHQDPALTNCEIDRLLDGLGDHRSAQPIDAETLGVYQLASPKGERLP